MSELEVHPDACRDLWVAVLLRAVSDAASVAGRKLPRPIRTADTLDRVRALEWITRRESGFEEVCGLAGFDPDHIVEAVVSGRASKVLKARTELLRPSSQRYEHLS